MERLVEFGLGMAVANQMIATMNQAIGSMTVPGAQMPMGGSATRYFVVVDGAQAGPYTEEQVGELIAAGKIDERSLVWRTGLSAWMVASNLPDMNKLFMLHKK
ncbi:MAG: DUF4339 domain-containing protein [Alistipes sp.]|nr:DUF4339 domain-containing protein [Alistipes sp.]